MRSKQREEALKKLTEYTFVGTKITQVEACECIDIAINYIKELKNKAIKIEKILDEDINLSETGIKNCSINDKELKKYYEERKRIVESIKKQLLEEK